MFAKAEKNQKRDIRNETRAIWKDDKKNDRVEYFMNEKLLIGTR